MKKLRITSLCLAFALILGIGSSCANEPGSTANTNTVPPAADIPITEENIAAEPVDLSGLSEEELAKFNDYLYTQLTTADKNDELTISISLEMPLDDVKFDQAVEEKQLYNEAMIQKINAEIDALSEDMKTTTLSDSEVSEINTKKEKLTEELSNYSVRRQHCVNQIIAEIHEPEIKAFAEKYSLTDYNTIAITCTLSRVTVTAELILKLAADSQVLYLAGIDTNDEFHDYGFQNYYGTYEALNRVPIQSRQLTMI